MIKKIQPYEKLIEYVKNNPRKGLTIPHSEIETIIGIPYKSSRYSYHVSKANDKLTQVSLRLEPINGFGYRIIQDNQYVDSMRKAYNMAVRNIQKADFISNHTDITSLNIGEHMEWDTIATKIKRAKHTLEEILPKPTIKNP